MKLQILVGLLILAAVAVNCHEHPTKEDIQNELNSKVIYYGSTIRLRNQQARHHLFSMDVSYGSGSRGQVVTGCESDTELGSYFTIKSGNKQPVQTFTNPVKCGDIISLEHIQTGKSLYGSGHASPVSNKMEVCCQHIQGEGDGNDNFTVDCIGASKGTELLGKHEFYLQHANSNQYLAASRRHTFNRSNCGFNCPIMDHLEIACQRSKDNETKWKIVGGIILQKSQFADDKDNDPFGDYSDDDEEHYNPSSAGAASSNKKNGSNVDDDGFEEINFNRREEHYNPSSAGAASSNKKNGSNVDDDGFEEINFNRREEL